MPTHWTGPPCQARQAHRVRMYSNHLGVLNDLCVSSLWYVSVMPMHAVSHEKKRNSAKPSHEKYAGLKMPSASMCMMAMPMTTGQSILFHTNRRFSNSGFVVSCAMAMILNLTSCLVCLRNDEVFVGS